MINRYKNKKTKRQIRTRASLTTSKDRPRLTVFSSNKYTSSQIIDDTKGVTLVSATTKKLDTKAKNMLDQSIALGEAIAK